MTCWAGHSTDSSLNRYLKNDKSKLYIHRRFMKKYPVSFLMIPRLIDFEFVFL